jgi:ankyrin repeat protein
MGNQMTKNMTVGHLNSEIQALMADPSCKKIPLAPANEFQQVFFMQQDPEEKLRLLKNFLEDNCDLVHSREMNGFPAIFMAVRTTPAIVKLFLEKGADPNMDCFGWRPLDFACAEGNPQIVKALMDAKADLNTSNPPTVQAVYRNNINLLEYLQELGANLHQSDEQGWTLLHYAAQCNHSNICRYLIQQNLKVNVTENEGWTPLHLAAHNGNLDTAQVLVELGASINEVDLNNRSALYKAIARNQLEMVQWLMKQGADPNMGKPTLHKAVSRSNSEIVSLLLESGVDVKRRDKKGHSALQLAQEQKNHEIIAMLIPQADLVTQEMLNAYLTHAINATATMVLQQVQEDMHKLEERIEKLEASLK